MARAALGWSVRDLANASYVGESTVNRFENGRGAPNQSTLHAIRTAMENAGVTFGENGCVFPPKSSLNAL